MVFTRGEHIRWHLDRTQIDALAAAHQFSWNPQIVFKVHVAQVPGVHRSRQIGAVAVPVQQVERRRLLPLQIVVDDVVPNEVVRAQIVEGDREITARHQAALAERSLALLHLVFVDEQVEHAGVFEVEQRRHHRHARHRRLAARVHHRECRCQDRAAHAKAERVDLLLTADLLRDVQRLDRALLEVIVPRQFRLRLMGVLPRHDENGMAASHRVPDE